MIESDIVSPEQAMNQIEIHGKKGIVNMTPQEPKNYQTISDIEIPKSMAYLLLDIDTGRETLNVRPYDALEKLKMKNDLLSL